MTRAATNDDFNANSRSLLFKIDIYFDGLSNTPTTVTKSDHLMSVSGLDETGAEDTNPLGAVSANEVDIVLFSQDGLFNPANTASTYYGKMKTKVPLRPYIKVDDEEVDWAPLGVFYVTDWTAPKGGTTATISAADVMQLVFNRGSLSLPVAKQETMGDFCTRIFDHLGVAVTVDESLTEILDYTYSVGTVKETLQELTKAALAYCTTDMEGNIVFKPFQVGDSVATLTDSDQIFDVEIKQSVIKTYDGVALTYYLHQLSDQEELINITDMTVPADGLQVDPISFSNTPLWVLTSLKLLAPGGTIGYTEAELTPDTLQLTLTNPQSSALSCDITAKGIYVETTSTLMSNNDDENPLEVDNKYIQNATYALVYKEILERFVNNPIPTVTLTVRGNPLINVGDTVEVQSTRYKLTYKGVVLRHSYKYTGGLTSELTLLNALILEG